MSRHKPQYTFAQLINTVEDLKKLYEQIQKENEMYREHTKRLEERIESVESHCNINNIGKPKRPKPGEGIISIKTPEKINGFAMPEYHEKPMFKGVKNGKSGPISGIRVKAEFSRNIQEEEKDGSLEEEALAELMEVENDLLKIENDETLEFPDIEHQNNASQFPTHVTTKMETFDLSDLKISRVIGNPKDLVSRIENEISAKIQNLDPSTMIESVKMEPGDDIVEHNKPTARTNRNKMVPREDIVEHDNYEKKATRTRNRIEPGDDIVEHDDYEGPPTRITRNRMESGDDIVEHDNHERPATRITRNKGQSTEVPARPKRQSTEAMQTNENGKQRKINETIKNYNEMQSAKVQVIKSKTRNNKPPSKFDKFEMDEEQVDEAIEEQSKNVIEVKKRTSPNKKVKVYCKCKSTYTKNSPMIGCDGPCQDWYHFDCVGIPQNFRSIAEWYCEECFFKITNGSIEVCLCGGWFEPAHELVRCKSVCKKLYHPGCLGLDNANMVERWEEEREGKCGYCNS
eukprot:TRINITY_DN75670_c0_g1_i1.p1 TRINITY_DN75670_c0_g1~~TRINITY_DN75670_c0_g1_i1.p1  ORF type:complete len:516 (-),score=133.16 TRINITY_DN75670_c0_g1_i1:206-1753(-)